ARGDVLAEQHDAIVARHLVVERVVDRGDEVRGTLTLSPSANTWRMAVDGSGSGAAHASVIASSTSAFSSSWIDAMVASVRTPCWIKYAANRSIGSSWRC